MKKSRTFRKSFVAAIAALCLAAPLAVMPVQVETSYAEGETTAQTTYKAYQIFKGEYSDGVLSNIDWGNDVNSEGLIEVIRELKLSDQTKPFTSVQSVGDVARALGTGEDTPVAKEFANVIADKIKENATPLTVSPTGSTDVDDGVGYYLVQTDNVASTDAKVRYILQVSGGTISIENLINRKSSAPTITKKVKENTDVVDYSDAYKDYNDIADYDIGDNIPIVDIGTLPSTLDDYDKYYYEIVDTSDATLKPQIGEANGKVTDVTVKIDGVDVTDKATITTEIQNGETIIKVVFEDIKSVNQGKDDGGNDVSVSVKSTSKVTVEYDAKLTKEADIGRNGQESEVYLNFSNNPNENYNPNTTDTIVTPPTGVGKTQPDKVIVFTYQIDITKYLESSGNRSLAGLNEAGFKLFKNIENKEYVADIDAATGAVTWIEASNDDKGKSSNGTEIKTDASGKVNFVGIDEGDYVLKETTTPVSYNTMPDMSISIVADTKDNDEKGVDKENERQNWSTNAANALEGITCTYDGATFDLENGAVKFEIVNVKGSSLPSTGGIGTTIFYLGGGTMAAVAGVYLITKKRMKNEEDDEI